MAETKEASTRKSRIETLSDLIFGLALSIGALTLIGQPPADFAQLIRSILFYAFSFLILISVWYGYTRNMSLLKIEKGRLAALNVLLLFLVSIEPYLFNELFGANPALVENVSILYALDLGGLFVIQALLANAIVYDKNVSEHHLRDAKLRRASFAVNAAILFVSILPVFWSWSITADGVGIPVRILLWLVTLFLPGAVRLLDRIIIKR